MKEKKEIAGIFIILMMVMLGGSVGMLTSYFLTAKTVAAELETEPLETLQQELEQKETKDIKEVETENEGRNAENQTSAPIVIDGENMRDINQALGIWKGIIFQTAAGNLSYQAAGKLLYSLSSEIYKRNLPEEYSLYWLKNVMINRRDQENRLKDVQFSEITYKKEDLAVVEVVEIYEKATGRYRLKLKKENGQWRFTAQISR
ncbi:hypothetical protein [Thermotalea metallivorans]|uniref:Uncharacterized protein n=1 Tax=Thermotalea metallivorans TaxID=520762 RepID=A0A140L7D0_9FIRM|nr:hypothetical protein [Thermotalea metallivorans]KXG76455.1 hypothetical protein AN619_09860 [Thermotalea metallivorans]